MTEIQEMTTADLIREFADQKVAAALAPSPRSTFDHARLVAVVDELWDRGLLD